LVRTRDGQANKKKEEKIKTNFEHQTKKKKVRRGWVERGDTQSKGGRKRDNKFISRGDGGGFDIKRGAVQIDKSRECKSKKGGSAG